MFCHFAPWWLRVLSLLLLRNYMKHPPHGHVLGQSDKSIVTLRVTKPILPFVTGNAVFKKSQKDRHFCSLGYRGEC